MQLDESKLWNPTDFGWGKREGQDVYYRQNFDLRQLRPNVWLLRKRTEVAGEVSFLVKAFQYIHPLDYNFAKKVLDTYLYPQYDKEYTIE